MNQVKELTAEEALASKDRVIRTYSGRYIDVFDPNPDDILLEDIFHGLALESRWGNQCPHFYSVAQHSVLTAQIVKNTIDPKLALEALLHDASEAYLHDMPKPIKNAMPDYRMIEDGLMGIIAKKFGFNWPLDPAVHAVDGDMLKLEWNALMVSDIPDYSRLGGSPWDPVDSEAAIRQMYYELTDGTI